MKIAIIGSGISGLIAALLLDHKYDVTVFEAAPWIGGHVHTIPVQSHNANFYIDTGFIVCNSVNYPNFLKLLRYLDVELQKTPMSFSVSAMQSNLEYSGTSINGLFAQRKNLFRPKYWRMLRDILRFNSAAKQFAIDGNENTSLADFIKPLNLSHECREYYLLPMISAIWSLQEKNVSNMPAKFLCQFFSNHGLLNINDRPQWYTIKGGSYLYVDKLVKRLKNPPLLNTCIKSISRLNNKIQLEITSQQEMLEFDRVIIATHSDQALDLLQDPTDSESKTLSQMRYQSNSVILHTDITRLPRNKRAWASWNFYVGNTTIQNCTVTYNMNILQNLNSTQTYCVSLNQDELIDPNKVIGNYNYSHPVLNVAALHARKDFYDISGVNNTYFCGAYWGAGFHEDGINSGLRVVKQIDEELFCATQYTLDW